MQSTFQQSSRGPVPSGASHGGGPVPPDHACRDASASGESGLQFPAVTDQQHSGGDRVLAFKTDPAQFDQ